MIAPSILAFIILYLRRFLLVMRCDDWLIMWIGLEINIIRFILIIYKYKDINRREVCMKYFFIQRLGSLIFVGMYYMDSSNISFLRNVVLIYKMGAGPFYFWFPSVMQIVSWEIAFMLIRFQKLIPLLLLRMMMRGVIWVIVVVRLIVGAVGSFNQKSLRRLFAYSSIHHVGWIIIRIIIFEKLWVLYVLIYIMILLGVVLILIVKEIDYVEEVLQNDVNWMFFIGILRIAGIPPFLGFFLKWLVFYWVLGIRKVIMVLLVIMSVIIFYVYMRVVYRIMIEIKVRVGVNLKDKIWVETFGELLRILGIIIGPLIVYFVFFENKIKILLTFKVKSGTFVNLQFTI